MVITLAVIATIFVYFRSIHFSGVINYIAILPVFFFLLFVALTIRQFITKFQNRSQGAYLVFIILLNLFLSSFLFNSCQFPVTLFSRGYTVYPTGSGLPQPPRTASFLTAPNILFCLYIFILICTLLFTNSKLIKKKEG
jgi:hypothetical protein